MISEVLPVFSVLAFYIILPRAEKAGKLGGAFGIRGWDYLF
jgi:hypothetical protein